MLMLGNDRRHEYISNIFLMIYFVTLQLSLHTTYLIS